MFLKIRHQSLGGSQFHKSLLVRDLRCQSSFRTEFGLIHGLLPCDQSVGDYLKFLVQAHQFIVGGGYTGDDARPHRFLSLDSAEITGQFLFLGPSQSSPKIHLPLKRGLDSEFRRVRFRIRSPVIAVIILRIAFHRDGRQLGGSLHTVPVLHLLQTLRSDEDVFVIFQSRVYKLLQFRRLIHFPPVKVSEAPVARILEIGFRHLSEVRLIAIPRCGAGI